jgi:hypothetical protein
MARARESASARRDAGSAVTLVIYGWYDSQPGTLAWVFPSLTAALRAVGALRNAVEWLIIEGRRILDEDIDVDALRRAGGVLIESGIA